MIKKSPINELITSVNAIYFIICALSSPGLIIAFGLFYILSLIVVEKVNFELAKYFSLFNFELNMCFFLFFITFCFVGYYFLLKLQFHFIRMKFKKINWSVFLSQKFSFYYVLPHFLFLLLVILPSMVSVFPTKQSEMMMVIFVAVMFLGIPFGFSIFLECIQLLILRHQKLEAIDKDLTNQLAQNSESIILAASSQSKEVKKNIFESIFNDIINNRLKISLTLLLVSYLLPLNFFWPALGHLMRIIFNIAILFIIIDVSRTIILKLIRFFKKK